MNAAKGTGTAYARTRAQTAVQVHTRPHAALSPHARPRAEPRHPCMYHCLQQRPQWRHTRARCELYRHVMAISRGRARSLGLYSGTRPLCQVTYAPAPNPVSVPPTLQTPALQDRQITRAPTRVGRTLPPCATNLPRRATSQREPMSERCCGQREVCNVCGSSEWVEAHFTGGVVVCLACWREIERSKRKSPPRQPALHHGEPAKEGGLQR
jgi:hypothetical protein